MIVGNTFVRSKTFDRFVAAAHSSKHALLEETSENITSAIQKSIRRGRRIQMAVCVSAAVFLIGIVGTWKFMPMDESDHSAVANGIEADSIQKSHAERIVESKPQAIVELAPESKYLAVPLKTSNSNVTVLWLYPTHEPDDDAPSSQSERNEPLLLAGIPQK